MRTTVNIDDTLFQDVLNLTNAKSKTEALNRPDRVFTDETERKNTGNAGQAGYQFRLGKTAAGRNQGI
ncbi:MAG: hypothetical protein D3906_13820 [Candidatus Electrothrix sp. AUS1_2]|nr:hypothetical protein [Candidatus Electrothrix sp. AUS1_2]